MKIKKLESKHKIIEAVVGNKLTKFYVSHEEIFPWAGDFDGQDDHLIVCGLPEQIIKLKELWDDKMPKVYFPIDNVIFVE